MRLSKQEVERRFQVALSFFEQNPSATAEQFNAGLTNGSITGQKEPMMGSKSVYDARTKARAIVAKAARGANGEAFKNARRPTTVANSDQQLPISQEALGHAKALLEEISKLGLSDLTVRSDGSVSVGRLERNETTVQAV